MKIIVIDDEIAALNTFLYGIVDRADVECNMFYSEPLASLDFVKENKVDVAFLDINMPTVNGVELAQKLIETDSRIKIIFISGYIHDEDEIKRKVGDNLLGFCYKPYNTDVLHRLIRTALLNVDNGMNVEIKTFGNFDIFIDNQPIKFTCTKSKELLALLVDSCGGYISMDYSISRLWPDKFIGNSKRLYRDALYKLRKELSNNDLDIIETSRAQIRLKTDNIKCDYWDYRKCKTPYYNGIYMAGYNWSTDTQYVLDELYK